MTFSTSSAWNSGTPSYRCGRRPRRALEIAGIVMGFIWFWPAALAYVVWKMMGYPKSEQLRSVFQDACGRLETAFRGTGRGTGGGFGGGFGPPSSGNAAFDEYRRKELDRLEEERRKLDVEARAFSDFVEELKRAKDREEFDAFMARRRADQGGPTTSV
ncbi:MAG: DUF2852 domain-containing protein [Microvirga sp.]